MGFYSVKLVLNEMQQTKQVGPIQYRMKKKDTQIQCAMCMRARSTVFHIVAVVAAHSENTQNRQITRCEEKQRKKELYRTTFTYTN